MFINLSNHPSSLWMEKQIEVAKTYGDIIDMSFPQIDPEWDDSMINQLVDEYLVKVCEYDKPVVMLQGEMVFSYRLITKLKEKGIKVVAACSKRVAIEKHDEEGNSIKTSIFQFIRFREY